MAHLAKWTDFSNLDSEQLLAAANAKLPRWTVLVLTVLIAWQLARIFWMLMPGAAETPIASAPVPGNTSGADSSLADTWLIANTHLFGVAPPPDAEAPPPEPSGPNPEELPDARVAFQLTGTMAAADPDLAMAIIEDSAKVQKVYHIGDTLQSGTTLHEVHAELVVLRQNGALAKLKLPEKFTSTAPPVRRSTPATTARTSTANNNSIQNVVAQNVSKLADVIRPTPYFVGGQQQGYRVYPGRDRKQFAALGLRPGDLIKDIDGAALTDPKQAMEIFQNLGAAEEVSVTVERNGQPQTLVLKTSQLALDDETQ